MKIHLLNFKFRNVLLFPLLILILPINCKLLDFLSKKNRGFCHTDELLKQSMVEDPGLKERLELQNNTLRNYINNNSAEINSTSRASGGANFVIPIVIYIVHNGGVENISDQQVHSQIDKLNSEFNPHGIEFCLATKENTNTLPGSGPDPGIIRINSPLTNHLIANESSLKALSPLSGNRYLKIWVIKDIVGDNKLG